MSRLRLFHDYPSQVRIFALLLILCLVIQLPGATYLYGRAKEQPARELEDRLQRAAGIAIKRVGLDPYAPALRSLQGVVEETGVTRVFLWGTAGRETGLGLGPPEQPAMSAAEEARAGMAFLTGFYGDRRQGYSRALLVPLPPDSAGKRRVLGIEARTDLLGFLHRIRWLIIGGYTGGLLLALVLCALFVRSILRPYARLTSLAPDLRRAEGVVPQEGSVDIDFVVSTVQRATEALRQKEGELSRLYAAERNRAETLDHYQQTILGSISSGVISFKPDLTIA